MMNKPTEGFKREAVRIALASGLPRKQVSADLGVGHSTLNRWVKAFGDAVTAPGKESELVNEIERLRRELRIVTEEREVPKKGHGLFRGPKAMRFASISGYPGPLCQARLCQLFDVSRAGCAPGDSDRPASVSATTWCCLRISANNSV